MTKIILSEIESYEIKIPEELDRLKLEYVIEKLSSVLKLMKKDTLEVATTANTSVKKIRILSGSDTRLNRKRLLERLTSSREESVSFCKDYYFSKVDFNTRLSNFNLQNETPAEKQFAYKIVKFIKAKHAIFPQDINIAKWPNRKSINR